MNNAAPDIAAAPAATPEYRNVLNWLGIDAIGNDARREPRVSVEARITLVPLSDVGGEMSTVSVLTRDLTPAGIGLLSDCAMPPGQRFVLNLPGGGTDGDDLRVVCEVRYCEPGPAGRFHVGAAFAG